MHNSINTVYNQSYQREYDELMDFLTLYVNMQKPLIECIKINITDKHYIITDSDDNIIFSLIEYDDTLIDVLVTLAPKLIKLFNPQEFKNKEIIKTIVGIFKERVEINYRII